MCMMEKLHKPGKLYLPMGSSLIEVLVSLLVISGGLLGVAAMYSVSMRNNQAAYYRSQATTLGIDMVERMGANKRGVVAGDYNDGAGAATAACFTTPGCTPAQMAAQDVLDWSTRVAAVLPGGDSVVCIDSSGNDGTAAAQACDNAGRIYAVKIWWDDDRDGVAEMRYTSTWRPL